MKITRVQRIAEPGRGPSRVPAGAFALFELGFRPFYFVAATYAAIGVLLWLAVHAGVFRMPLPIAPQWWHMHEMVFGFALAVVVGFLFTAVRNWTGRDTPRHGALARLVGLWIGARVAFHAGLIALGLAIELALLVLVAHALLQCLVAAGNRRNYFVGALFVALALADLAFGAAVYGLAGFAADVPLRAALYLIVLLTGVLGGRVIPSFTANSLRGVRQFRHPALDAAALVAGAIAFAAELGDASAGTLALAAAAAAMLHAVRLAGWAPLATWRQPMLWILHAGYGWTAIGFALLAASALGWVARPLALHAFAVGTIGGLVIGMITRTALGHTGRPLVAGRAELTMYVLVTLAAAVRVFGPLAWPAAPVAANTVAALLWAAGFGLYALVYWPRLSRARVDGRPG